MYWFVWVLINSTVTEDHLPAALQLINFTISIEEQINLSKIKGFQCHKEACLPRRFLCSRYRRVFRRRRHVECEEPWYPWLMIRAAGCKLASKVHSNPHLLVALCLHYTSDSKWMQQRLPIYSCLPSSGSLKPSAKRQFVRSIVISNQDGWRLWVGVGDRYSLSGHFVLVMFVKVQRRINPLFHPSGQRAVESSMNANVIPASNHLDTWVVEWKCKWEMFHFFQGILTQWAKENKDYDAVNSEWRGRRIEINENARSASWTYKHFVFA